MLTLYSLYPKYMSITPELKTQGLAELEIVLQARLISLSHHFSYGKMTGLRYQEYIGTSECSSSSELCDKWLNSSEGRNSAAWEKILTNIGEEDLWVWIVPEPDLRVLVTKTSTNYLIPNSLLVKFIWDSGDFPKLKTSEFSHAQI